MEQNKNYIEVTARFNLDCIKSLLSHFDIKTSDSSTKPAETQHGAAVGLTEASNDTTPIRTRERWTQEMEDCLVANQDKGHRWVAEELSRRYGKAMSIAAVSSRSQQIKNDKERKLYDAQGKGYWVGKKIIL